MFLNPIRSYNYEFNCNCALNLFYTYSRTNIKLFKERSLVQSKNQIKTVSSILRSPDFMFAFSLFIGDF